MSASHSHLLPEHWHTSEMQAQKNALGLTNLWQFENCFLIGQQRLCARQYTLSLLKHVDTVESTGGEGAFSHPWFRLPSDQPSPNSCADETSLPFFTIKSSLELPLKFPQRPQTFPVKLLGTWISMKPLPSHCTCWFEKSYGSEISFEFKTQFRLLRYALLHCNLLHRYDYNCTLMAFILFMIINRMNAIIVQLLSYLCNDWHSKVSPALHCSLRLNTTDSIAYEVHENWNNSVKYQESKFGDCVRFWTKVTPWADEQ